MNDADYLQTLATGHAPGVTSSTAWQGLDQLLQRVEPDLVLYDAGVDVHQHDALGHLQISDQGLATRDRFVIDTCRAHGIPTACVIGGGYDKNHHTLAQRHATLHHAAQQHLDAVSPLAIP